MEFTDLYTVESLQCFNGFHNRGYQVNRSDTDKVNRLIATIRQEREKNIGPVAGDSIEYTCRNGDWFHSAHIEDIRNGHLKICLSGSVPFCYENGAGTGYNVHEGIWTYPGKALLKPAGSRLKQFRTWDIPENAPTEKYISWPSYVHGNIRSRNPYMTDIPPGTGANISSTGCLIRKTKASSSICPKDSPSIPVRNWTSSSGYFTGNSSQEYTGTRSSYGDTT